MLVTEMQPQPIEAIGVRSLRRRGPPKGYRAIYRLMEKSITRRGRCMEKGGEQVALRSSGHSLGGEAG